MLFMITLLYDVSSRVSTYFFPFDTWIDVDIRGADVISFALGSI